MGPVTGQTEDLSTGGVICIARWIFRLGHFVGQPGPLLEIGMRGTGNSYSHGMLSPPAGAACILNTIEAFVTGTAEIVHAGNIYVFLKTRVCIRLNGG